MVGTIGARGPLKPFEFYDSPGVTAISTTPLIVFPFDSGQDSFILQDPAGVLWRVGIQDNGQLQTNSGAVGLVNVIVFNDPQQTASWRLDINTNGQPVAFQVNYNAAYPTIRWMGSITGLTVWGLETFTNGQLFDQTTPTILDDSFYAGFIKVSTSTIGTW